MSEISEQFKLDPSRYRADLNAIVATAFELAQSAKVQVRETDPACSSYFFGDEAACAQAVHAADVLYDRASALRDLCASWDGTYDQALGIRDYAIDLQSEALSLGGIYDRSLESLATAFAQRVGTAAGAALRNLGDAAGNAAGQLGLGFLQGLGPVGTVVLVWVVVKLLDGKTAPQ